MFANLVMAWGLGAVAIPILIHLLNRQRYRTVEWAAMEFLLKAIKQNARKLQLRDILLMLIRTAAVLFFVLALLRPVVCSFSAGPFGKETVRIVVVDISGSMDANDGGKTVMQSTVESIRETVKRSSERLDANPRSILLTTPIDSNIELPDGASDPTVFDGHLAAIRQTGGAADFARTMERVRGLVAGRFKGANIELYIFSDMQRNAWQLDNKDLAENMRAIVDNPGHIYMVDVAKSPLRNVTIETFRSTDDTVLVGHEIPFLATLKNSGAAGDVDVTAEFYVDGRVKYQQVVTVKSGGTEQLTFTVRPDTRGEHRVTLKLSADNLAIDNEAHRILLAEDKMRILIVDGNPRDMGSDSAGLFLKKVYTTTDLDLAALETADQAAGSARAVRQSGIARISVDEWAEQNLADAQLICLAGVPRIPPGMGDKLKRFVARGGGLMIFPSADIDIPNYIKELGAAPPVDADGEPGTRGTAKPAPADDELSLLPCTWTNWWGTVPDPKSEAPVTFHSISSKDISHPILLPFSESGDYQQLLANIKIYRGLDMQLVATDSPDIGIVARLDDDRVLAAIRTVGSGQVLMWGTACDTQMTNLPWFGAYFILMERSAEYLTIGSHPPLNLLAGDELLHPVGELDAGAYYQLTDPFSRKETMPAPYRRGARWVVSTPDEPLYPGYISVQKGAAATADNSAAADPDDGLEPLTAPDRTDYAISARPEEFNLSAWSENALRAGLPGVDFTYMKDSKTLADALVTGSQGIELWWFFLLLVFALLVTESYLVILWKPGNMADDPANPKSALGFMKSGFGIAGRLGQSTKSSTANPVVK